MDKNNRYTKLLSFTLILGIGTVISKLMTYVVLTPLYTHTLTEAEFGIVDLVVQTANLLMPLACASRGPWISICSPKYSMTPSSLG